MLISDGLINAQDDCPLPFRGSDRDAIRGFSPEASADFAGDDASETVGLIVRAIIRRSRPPLSTTGRHVARPKLARASRMLLGLLLLLQRGRRKLQLQRLRRRRPHGRTRRRLPQLLVFFFWAEDTHTSTCVSKFVS